MIISGGALRYYSGTTIYKMKQRISKNDKKEKKQKNKTKIKPWLIVYKIAIQRALGVK